VSAPSPSDPPSRGFPGGGVPGPYDEIGRLLAEMPRPRPVRMSLRGKIVGMIVSIALLASFGIYAAAGASMQRTTGLRDNGPSPFPMYGLSIFIVVAFGIFIVTTIGRQKSLLAGGEMAIAQVTKQWAARNGPNITYEFTTPLGEHFSRNAADASRKLSVGMSVPVFYDPQSPKKQLALCASFYELVLPGKN
jgi:hypothetical protein